MDGCWVIDSMVTPKATVRAVVLDAAVLTTLAAAVAMTSDGVETDAVTTTEPGGPLRNVCRCNAVTH